MPGLEEEASPAVHRNLLALLGCAELRNEVVAALALHVGDVGVRVPARALRLKRGGWEAPAQPAAAPGCDLVAVEPRGRTTSEVFVAAKAPPEGPGGAGSGVVALPYTFLLQCASLESLTDLAKRVERRLQLRTSTMLRQHAPPPPPSRAAQALHKLCEAAEQELAQRRQLAAAAAAVPDAPGTPSNTSDPQGFEQAWSLPTPA